MNRNDLAKIIFETSHLTGEFLLRSGKISNEYFDKYLFEANPEILKYIASFMSELIPSDCEVLAGLEMGGIPIATSISLHTGLPCAFIRKKAKDYGTRKVNEGADITGKKIVIIEDVITSGGQVILSAEDLKNAGAHILCCICVINRQQGGSEALQEAGIPLISLFTMEELKNT
ncbi:MAG: orotate phosphoribosyltransferase [Ignavibacteria bacterium]|jgi:orotate phosphoribosyltransferase